MIDSVEKFRKIIYMPRALDNFYVTKIFLMISLIVVSSCKEKSKALTPKTKSTEPITHMDSPLKKNAIKYAAKRVVTPLTELPDTTFIRLADYSEDFAYDLRYATENNFLKAKVYDCPECYTRVKTAKALLEANKDFREQGVKIKFFDCYRPNSVQYKMWEIVPNPQYVANPVKGSIHNRGGAVDITLVSLDGKELDMGTDFDFFGKLAYHDNLDLPQKILDNRKLLKEIMENHGFWSIRTEWWHYNLGAASKDNVANFKWDCK